MEKKEGSPNPNDIFTRTYEGGTRSHQAGKFRVVATSLGPDGKAIGGGSVETFNSKEDAKKCVNEINGINPAHEAKIVDNPEA